MKRWMMIGGVVVVLAVLIGGAITAVTLLAESNNSSNSAEAAASGGRMMQSVEVGNDGVPVSVQTTILPDEDLPDEQPEVSGIVLAREDDVLTLGTGDIDVSVEVKVDAATGQEQTTVVPSTNGPELEVVLTRDTLFFRDVTDVAGQQPAASGEVTITQEVQPVDNPDLIEPQMEVQVWGERSGDRITAEIVVFGPLGDGTFE